MKGFFSAPGSTAAISPVHAEGTNQPVRGTATERLRFGAPGRIAGRVFARYVWAGAESPDTRTESNTGFKRLQRSLHNAFPESGVRFVTLKHEPTRVGRAV